MDDSFLQDLNKESLDQLPIGLVWPSTIFWLANLIIAIQLDANLNLDTWSKLPNENKLSLVIISAIIILTTAWVLYWIVGNVYWILQGRPLARIHILRQRHVSIFEKLSREDMVLSEEIERLKATRVQLQSFDNLMMQNPESLEAIRTDTETLENMYLAPKSSNLPSTDFIRRLRQSVSNLESQRLLLGEDTEFKNIEARLKLLFQSTLNAIEEQLYRLEFLRTQNYESLMNRYPTSKKWITATTFGNCWGAIESYSITRYGIPMALLWPRLYLLLPKDTLPLFEQVKTRIDSFVAIWLLAGIFWIMWLFSLLIAGRGRINWLVLLFLILGFSVQHLSYRLAVSSSVSYGKLLKGAVDLYRRDVIRQMSLEIPLSLDAERKEWDTISAFWLGATDGEKLNFVDFKKETH